MTEYLSMSLEDAMASPVPMYYISFPCAKDPTWEQRHPGESVFLWAPSHIGIYGNEIADIAGSFSKAMYH